MTAVGEDWRRYPFELVPGNPQFDFPGAEGNHPDCESDTWFLAGQLTGDSGREYAFLTIVNKNRPGQAIVADFYTLALFDLDNGTYGSYTDYDMPGDMPGGRSEADAQPKLTVADGHLDLSYDSGAGTAVWRTCRDPRSRLEPYTYDVGLVGIDANGDPMRLDLHVTPSRAPVPLGAAAYNGTIECFGQPGTFSYYQTGLTMTGTLRWGAVSDTVHGSAGHVDRQWFPLVVGGGPSGDVRSRAHEWRTINLGNGADLSIWRQFDRADHNALQPFSGATMSWPDGGADPEFADDVEVTVSSYVRWPESVPTLIPPPAAARYLPDRHRLASRGLDLELVGEPLVAAPAHALPLEYMEGPFRYRGTLRGQPVSGFGFYERSLALYRDWELVDVLAAAVGGSRVETVRAFIEDARHDEAAAELGTLGREHPEAAQIIADLVEALRRN